MSNNIQQEIDQRRGLRSAYQQGVGPYTIESVHQLVMTEKAQKFADKISSAPCKGPRFVLIAHVGGLYHDKDPEHLVSLSWPAWGVRIMATGGIEDIYRLKDMLIHEGGCAGVPGPSGDRISPTGRWPTRMTIVEFHKWTDWPPKPNPKTQLITGDKTIDDLLNEDLKLARESDALMESMEDASKEAERRTFAEDARKLVEADDSKNKK